ncbi:MAG: NADH-quinone oxidoreductase subunit [Solirubrobacterales bacterium]|nr:NADH-quinone oxidoreductase subunit [Solirubrobacterales bacterium]
MSLVEVMFGLLGAVAVASALLVVTTKQLVHAALWLVVALGAVAGCYLLLSAEFVAWVQILIYVGAVVVLLLFGLMLTRAPIGVSVDLDAPPLQRAAAAVVSLGLACVVVVSAIDAFRGEHIRLDDDAGRGSSTSTGTALFRAWVLPFEVLSVLLLAALVGAIVLSRRDIGGDDSDSDNDDNAATFDGSEVR